MITNKAKRVELLMLSHIFPQWEDNFRAENTQIIHRLQFSLASVTGTSFSLSLIPLHQVFIKETHALPPLLQFWRCALEKNVQAQNQGGDV